MTVTRRTAPRAGFSVPATDFSAEGLGQLRGAAETQGVAGRDTTAIHDVREPPPLSDASVEAVFTHRLLSTPATRPDSVAGCVGDHRPLRVQGPVRAVVASGAVGLDPVNLHPGMLTVVTVLRGRRQRGSAEHGPGGQNGRGDTTDGASTAVCLRRGAQSSSTWAVVGEMRERGGCH